MAKKESLGAKPLEIDDIANYYNACEKSLRLYFSDKNPDYMMLFSDYTSSELISELNDRLTELGRSTSLSLLGALEAKFMIDCKERMSENEKDNLSLALIKWGHGKRYLMLDEKVLEIWRDNSSVESQLIGDLKGIYKYRHWLAHGRHFIPAMGKHDYDYRTTYALVELSMRSFPFK